MTFRVATWNLDHASNKSRPIARQIEQIRAINADIWILTETAAQVDLSDANYRCRTPYSRNEYGNFWTTVWTRSPFLSVEQLHSHDDETVTCVKVETPDGSFLVFGTILPYHMYRVAKDGARPWDEHHKAINAHGDDWARLRALHGIPLIVAGDFNQTRDGSRAYCSDHSIEMLDTQLARNHLVCITEKDFGKEGELGVDPKKGRYRHNVDHICLTAPSLRAVHTGAWDHFSAGQGLSDHNGVFADLAWHS